MTGVTRCDTLIIGDCDRVRLVLNPIMGNIRTGVQFPSVPMGHAFIEGLPLTSTVDIAKSCSFHIEMVKIIDFYESIDAGR